MCVCIYILTNLLSISVHGDKEKELVPTCDLIYICIYIYIVIHRQTVCCITTLQCG